MKKILILILALTLCSCSEQNDTKQTNNTKNNLINEETINAFVIAARDGDIASVKKYLESGINIDAMDKDSWTSLMHASENGQLEMVRFLLKNGADINFKNDNATTALAVAFYTPQTEIVNYLLANGAELSDFDDNAQSALMIASWSEQLEIIQYLIENGADVNYTEDEGEAQGWTALIYASQNGDIKIAKYLIEKGANINARNGNDETALDIAKDRGDEDLIELLTEAEKNIIPTNFFGEIIIYPITKENKAKLIKANNFYGYEGNIKITVKWYDENYASFGSKENIDKTYNAYLDASSEKKQAVIFHKSNHNKELQIVVNNKKLTLYYDKKKVLDSDMDEETYNELIKTIPLYKFPDNILNILYNLKGHGYEEYDMFNFFGEIVDIEGTILYYIEEAQMEHYDPSDDYSFKIGVDDDYRILGEYIGDNGNGYTWENGVIKEKSIGTMAEAITIEFLDKDGWLRR